MRSRASIRSTPWFCLAAAGAIVLLPPSAINAETATIVQDTIVAIDGTTINGRVPLPIDRPGSPWVNGNSPNVINGNQQIVGNDGATALSIASTGSYTKPTRFTISADLNLNEMLPSNEPRDTTAGAAHIIPRGITLGFFNVGGALNTSSLFTVRRAPYGVTYNDTGKLLLVVADPTDGLAVDVLAAVSTYGLVYRSIPTTGTHHLSYSVDTSTGSISNVTFDGYAIDFGVKTTQFTDANTNVAGEYAGSGTGNTFGQMNNFMITTTVHDGAAPASPRKL